MPLFCSIISDEKCVVSVFLLFSDSVWNLLFSLDTVQVALWQLDAHFSYLPFLVHSRLFHSEDFFLQFSYYHIECCSFLHYRCMLQFLILSCIFFNLLSYFLHTFFSAFWEICFTLQFTHSFSSYTNNRMFYFLYFQMVLFHICPLKK